MTHSLKLFDPTSVKPGESCSGVIHVCDVCGKRGRWNDQWNWYGSHADEELGVVVKTCGCGYLTEGREQLPTQEALILLKAKKRRIGLPIKARQ